MTETLHNAPIVLDNGSRIIRAGFAGEDLLKYYFLSFVSRLKYLRMLTRALEENIFINKRAEKLKELLKIRYSLKYNIIIN